MIKPPSLLPLSKRGKAQRASLSLSLSMVCEPVIDRIKEMMEEEREIAMLVLECPRRCLQIAHKLAQVNAAGV